MVDLTLRHYRGCFERIIVFSPSVDIDSAWEPVKEYVRVQLGVRDNEQCFFHEFDHAALEQIVADQHKLTIALKEKKGNKHLFNILILVDDFSDSPEVLHNQGKNELSSFMCRGRHQNISLWLGA